MASRDPIEFTNRVGQRVGNEVNIAGVLPAVNNNHTLPVRFGNSPSIDSFGRLRISEAISRFDSQFTYDLQPLLFEQITAEAGATIAHDATNRAALMTFSSTPANGQAYMQSYEWTYYHPGNSHQIFTTFNFREHAAGVTKFIGYSDLDNNGIQFISNGTGFAWRILSNSDLGDVTIPQAAWNLDKLDGTGLSGYTLDVAKTQIAVIDFQSLYVGRMRVGFDINGDVIYCHEFKHANIDAFPYWQTATLPVIAGMTTTQEASTTMLFICSTVRSEGATIEEEGFGFAQEGTATAGNDTRTHILSLRPKTAFNSLENRIQFLLESIEVVVTGNDPIIWELVIGQAISGTTTFNDVNTTYSGFEYNTAGTISGNPAIVIAKGYVPATNWSQGLVSKTILNRYPITLDAAGAVRALGTLSLLVTGIGATSTTRASLNWREIR